MDYFNFNLIETTPKMEFIFDGLHKRNIGIMGGIGSVGKSYFILEQVIKYILFKHGVSKKEPLLSMNFEKCLFITTEDEENMIIERTQNILFNLYEEEHLMALRGKIDLKAIGELLNTYFKLKISSNYKTTQETLKDLDNTKCEFVILDTLSVIAQLENENDNAEVAKKLETFKQIAQEKNIGILFIHHLNQSGIGIKNESEMTMDKLRGNTTFVNNTRYVAFLAKTEKDLVFKVVKSNYGKYTTLKMWPNFWKLGFKLYTPTIEVIKGGRDEE